ncbi:hypothetical protein Tco_0453733 [Tanacetum coccineum]
MTQKLGLGFGFTKKSCFVCGSHNHLIKDCDFHEKTMPKESILGKGIGHRDVRPIWNNTQRINHQNKFIPTAVLTRTGRIPVSTTKQYVNTATLKNRCKKQTVVANSTTKAEYIATSHCCGQVIWVQNQMLDYGFNFMQTKIHVDNESVICVAKNPIYHSKTKHIKIRNHFIRDTYEKRLIEMVKIHTDYNVADLLTKAFDI